ncbi:MAG: hypothetical protein GY821_14450 [Gammaproteobacteria bacterium]|nr:hypothetical protein [Gammaproteobacteria bacterium]
MAEGSKKFKLPQSNRARILMIAVLVIGAVLVGASLFHIHRSRQKNQASSSLGGVPSGIQSLPGGKQASQQYLKVLLKQNQLKANNALKSGKSAIPTMVNTGQTYIQTSDFKAKDQGAQCNCPLPGLQGSGASLLDQLAASGAITPSVAADLQRLQNQGASVEDYANELQKLVAEGKLTPAQAAKLLAAYRAKHGAAAAAGAAGTESPADIASRLLASGAITPQTAQALAQLNSKKLTPAQYQAALQRLVAEGKLTPAQARALMAAYRAKHGQAGSAAGISESPADIASDLLASGAITPETAQELAQLNNKKLTPEEYAAELQRLVREGKLTPEQARQLLASYKAHHAAAGTAAEGSESPADVASQLLASGAITPQTAQELATLNSQHLTPAQYQAELQRLVREGKLTPAQARALMAAYNRKHGEATAAAVGNGSTPDDVASQLLASGSITPATERELAALNNANLTPAQYQARLARLVAEGKLTPAQARALLAAYRRTHGGTGTASVFARHSALLGQLKNSGQISGQAAAELERLSAQNTPSSEYATQLANLVRSGKLSPAVAQRLLSAYMAKHGTVTLSDKAKTNPQLAQLERMRQQQQLRVQQQVLAQLQQQRQREQAQKTQQQLKSMENAMRSQSSALFASWAAPTPTMSSVGSSDATKKGGAAGAATGGAAAAAGSGGKKLTVPLVKTGSIMFAVLNTAINSDMPGVVMATIVSGKYKGAKLMGGLTLKKDRVELAFTSMSMADWPSVVTIKAVAINPDTARTAIASSVNHHYVSRYGALMASSFLEGYSQAVSNSGNTTISGDGTVTSSTATYSPAGRFMIALGNVGSKLGSAAEQNFNRSPTVKIDAGVGLGILFQGDVSTPDFLLKKVGDSTSSDGSTDNE